VGHENKDCCAIDMTREHTSDMYMIQKENSMTKGGGKYINERVFNQGNRGGFGRGRGRENFDIGGRGVGPFIFGKELCKF
jgi:hypothetical protein